MQNNSELHKNNVFYRSLSRITKVDTTQSQRDLKDFIDQSQQRIKTQQFLNSRSQYLLKSMLNGKRSLDKIVMPPYNRRANIVQAEKLFITKMCDGNRQELLQKMEQFIMEQLKENTIELAHLFGTYMNEFKNQIQDQQYQLIVQEKKLEIQNLDDYQRMRQTCKREVIANKDKMQELEDTIITLNKNAQQMESQLSDQQEKIRQFRQKIDIKEKEVIIKNKRIKNLQYEVQNLQNKIQYFENKVQSSKGMRKSIQKHQEKRESGMRKSFLEQKLSIPNIQLINASQIQSSSEENNSEEEQSNNALQLNELEINYDRIVQLSDKEIQVNLDFKQNPEMGIQTHLQLMDNQYDQLDQNSIEQVMKYNSFLIQINNRFENEDFDFESIISDTFESKDEIHSPGKFFKNKTSVNETPSPSPTLQFKKNKLRSIFKLINFQKTRLQQIENNQEEAQQKLESLFQKCDNLSYKNCQLEDEKQNLLNKIKLLQSQLEKQQSQIQNSEQQSQIEQEHIQGIKSSTHQEQQYKQQSRKPDRRVRKQFQLGQRVTISYDFQKNQSKLLIEKIKQKKMNKFTNFMPQKLVLKYITTLYQDKINSQKENKYIRDQDMSSYIYNYYLQQFGYTKITEQRFLVLVLSVNKYIKIVRINIFARFLNLIDDHSNYNIEEQQKYLEGLEFVQNQQNLGVNIKDNEADLKFYIPYVRAISYLGQLQSFCLSSEESSKLKQDIEHLKENDPKNINKPGIVDFDLMMIRVLQYFRNNFEKTKTYVINAFAACDLDGNGMCNIEEWLLLNKYIESDKYDEDKLIDVFDEQADIVDEKEKNLSFDRFSLLCMELELFSDHQQNRFLQIRKQEEVEDKFQQLCSVWQQAYINGMKELQEFNAEEKWIDILNVLNNKILNSHKPVKPLLIAYQIFQYELIELKQMHQQTE